MSPANSLFILLILLLSTTSCVLCQYTNCKDIGGGFKVEWTASTNTNRLTARFTLPNSAGYAAVGFKSGSTSGMAGSTILVANQNIIDGEYYANANTAPSSIQGAPYYTSASSSHSASVTTINLVRSLTRPQTAPGTYYEIVSGNSMKLLFATHSSSAYPVKHDSAFAYTLDLFASSTCTQPQVSTPKPQVSVKQNSTQPQNSTSSGNKTNDGASSTGMGREVLILISMIFALFATLATV